MKRGAAAEWREDLKTGKGTISLDSGALKQAPYSFATRFEDGVTGTNPEELIAGAHAACFSMALSAQLSGAGLKPESIKTRATLTMEKLEAGWTVTAIHLDCVAKVPGADAAKFDELADKAKAGCPISRLLNAKIALSKTLA
ncbi:MAG: OsmC family protein [Elusimicrobia bacterium]|nr:OsmC family protein [Elusimicrobiota bacterium]